MGVVKCLLLKYSKASLTRHLYEDRVQREAKISKQWKATQLTTKVEQIVDFNTRFAGQSNNFGLGHGVYNRSPSTSEHRNLCTKAVSVLEEQKDLGHSMSLHMQGLWSQWFEHTCPLDFLE